MIQPSSEAERELLALGAPLEIGATGLLALGISHFWEPERQVFTIITAYGDETGTHANSPVQMLAGWVGRLGRWNSFDVGWGKAIRRSGLPGYSHATEHWDTEAGTKFAPLAQRLTEQLLLFGYVVELDKDSYEKHYIAQNRPKKPQLDTMYSLCFRYLLAFLLVRLPTLVKTDDILLNIVLEEGAAGSADALRVVAQLRKQPETQDIVKMLGGVSFEPKEKWPGLQASDALAFGAAKLMPSSPEMIDAPEGASLAYAARLPYKPPIYHVKLDQPQLAMLKSDILTMVEIRKQIAAEAIAARDGVK